MPAADVLVAGRAIGPGHPVYVIAEAGVNHNGELRLAERLVHAAADAGADAVKFQTFRADALATAGAGRAAYQRDAVGEGTQRDMLRRLELDEDAHRRLQILAKERGVAFLSTPFDEASAAFLARLGVPAFKVGSGDLTNHPLLRVVASYGRPVLLSTGMATLGEAKDAAQVVRSEGAPLLVLHCTSRYPAPLDSLHLRAIATLRDGVQAPVGYSDHSQETWTGAVAVAEGAVLLEKHLTLDRSLPGPDHRASLMPSDFALYVKAARGTAAALGRKEKQPSAEELEVAKVARKSVVTAHPLAAGTILAPAHLCMKRPGTGIPPTDLPRLLGRRLRRAIEADRLLSWEDVE